MNFTTIQQHAAPITAWMIAPTMPEPDDYIGGEATTSRRRTPPAMPTMIIAIRPNPVPLGREGRQAIATAPDDEYG